MTARPNSADMAVGDTPNDIAVRIKRALAADLRECRLSRAEVALELSGLTSRPITEAQIDSWTAATKAHRIPIELVPAWVGVTGSRRVLDLLCEGAGPFHVATERERDLAEMARVQLARESADRKLAEIRERLCGER